MNQPNRTGNLAVYLFLYIPVVWAALLIAQSLGGNLPDILARLTAALENPFSMDSLIGLCLGAASKNPIEIMNSMMGQLFCHMHGPEHHVMVGSALLTAYKNAGGNIDLHQSLIEMMSRGKSVPGGACGFWGACGAGISAGMFVSIISKSTPLTVESFGLSNLMTSRALEQIGTVGGPRCCKRDSFLSILAAIDFVQEHFGIEMERQEIICDYAAQNNQCIGIRCPFSKANHR